MDIREMRKRTGMTQHDFAQRLGIPKRTVQNWETSERECPQYVKQLIYYFLKNEGIMRTDNAEEQKNIPNCSNDKNELKEIK